MNRRRTIIGGAALFLALQVAVVLAQQVALPEGNFRDDLLQIQPEEHIRFLSSEQSRFTGYEGCYGAEDYIAGRFEQLGLSKLRRTSFQMIVPKDRGATLTLLSEEEGTGEQAVLGRFPIYCLVPNYVRTPKTVEGGIEGKLVWGNEGYLRDFDGKEVMGNIVLMRFNTATRWLNAAKLGAEAIIFVEPDEPYRTEAEQKYTQLPLPVGRYYLTKEQLRALASTLSTGAGAEAADPMAVIQKLGSDIWARANVKADMVWEEKTVHAVSAEIPGTDPDLTRQQLVCHAYYDSTSVVPALSPGAESACGVAVLLEAAEFLSKHPPRRTVKFVATPGHFQALGGIRHYAFETIYAKRFEEEEPREPYFFIGLDLSSRQHSMAAFYKGQFYDQLGAEGEIKLQRIYSDYSGLLLEWAGDLLKGEGVIEGLEFQSGIVPQRGRDWRSLVPDRVALDGEVITMCSRPAVTLVTTGDPRNTVDTPLDTFERLEPYLENVRNQAIVSTYLIKRTADLPVIPLNGELPKDQVASIFGKAIDKSLVAYVPTSPIADIVASVSLSETKTKQPIKSLMGVKGMAFVRSDRQGFFEVFGLEPNKEYRVDGFDLSVRSGVVQKVAESELVEASSRERPADYLQRETDLRLKFFRCVSTSIFDLMDPLQLRPMTKAEVVSGGSNSELRYIVKFVGMPREGTSYNEPCGVFFTKRGRSIKFMLSGGMVGADGLLLNVAEEEAKAGGVAARQRDIGAYSGTGFNTEDDENFIYNTGFQITSDMHILDGYRLRKLKSTGIFKKKIWELHEQAGIHLERAQEKLQARRYDDAYRELNRAWGMQNRVYPDVRGTSMDVVRGVIFYFALLLPFVIFTERLLINFVDIRKKLAAVGVLFAISYFVLRLVHPAFKLSKTPIIILIGFFMFVVGLFVIVLLLQKFQAVMERVRQHLDLVHRADVARASAAMAAFILGISNMRKRKARTVLTALTLILLTFTILSFTSFETYPVRVLRYASSEKAPYDGILLRSLTWSPLPEFTVYDLVNFFKGEDMRIAERSWFVNREKTEELRLDIKRVGGRGEAVASAMLGLSPAEKDFSRITDYLDEGQWFSEQMKDWPFVCILPGRMCESLGVEPSELGRAKISVLGRYLTVVGKLNSQRFLTECRDLDSEPMTPVDFVKQEFERPGMEEEETGPTFTPTGEMTVEDFVSAQGGEESGKDRYIHMDPDRVLIVPHQTCVKLGGTIRSVAAGTVSGGQGLLRPFLQTLNEFTNRVNMAFYAGVDGFVNRVATRAGTSVGGLKGLVVPVLIAALIVFNTMLGAVYERVTEIKVYASVGLAPMHIASLFLAESSVFAVVGVMVGYLLGQVISFGLVHVPSLMEGMSLNYSSMSAVWSAVLVLMIVLGSTAWPAMMAGRVSVPDETRKMRLPRPISDVWEIKFPFTVSSREALGVMAFLRQYFKSNDEDSVGTFTADNLRFYTEQKEGQRQIVLESDVWVAPLDMGISQAVAIRSIPAPEEPEITDLFFTIVRKSGEFQTWHRMNMGFMRDLRKQLLIWRLVTPQQKLEFTRQGEALIAGEAVDEL